MYKVVRHLKKPLCGQLGESLEVPAYMALIRFYTEVGASSKALELYDSLVHKARNGEQFVSNSGAAKGVNRYFMLVGHSISVDQIICFVSNAWSLSST